MSSTLLRLLPVLVVAPLALLPESEPQAPPREGLVTLYAHDDLASSFDFRSGTAGGRVVDGEVRLAGAQLVYGAFLRDQLSFGFVRNERVEVFDLGDARVAPQVRARDQAAEFPVSVLHTLAFDGARFTYLGPGGDVHAFEPADRILGSLPPEELRHLQPQLGHTYLLRLHHEGVGLGDEFFAFEVVDLEPARRLTMRWTAVPRR
ncbi:MAG: hypothetical protein EXS08_08720 [Planctomycetes bacterium]|nr:hypothetical protein [Planctomycetota bacterium]